ncbi:hypothetical protein SCALM49S_06600 [Streptomyces californicus]
MTPSSGAQDSRAGRSARSANSTVDAVVAAPGGGQGHQPDGVEAVVDQVLVDRYLLGVLPEDVGDIGTQLFERERHSGHFPSKTVRVVVTTAHLPAAHRSAIAWSSAEKSATASATTNAWISCIQASHAVISTPMWA